MAACTLLPPSVAILVAPVGQHHVVDGEVPDDEHQVAALAARPAVARGARSLRRDLAVGKPEVHALARVQPPGDDVPDRAEHDGADHELERECRG